MEAKKILKRENKLTIEQHELMEKTFNGVKLSYNEVYYLDFEVNEDTGMINKSRQVKHYTKNQVKRNLKALKTAYLIDKGAVSPDEIIKFRTEHRIAASTLSLILGFSKNTISNIENGGVTSLASGRLIKMCLNDRNVLYHYIKICDFIDNQKKDELFNKLMSPV